MAVKDVAITAEVKLKLTFNARMDDSHSLKQARVIAAQDLRAELSNDTLENRGRQEFDVNKVSDVSITGIYY